MAEGLWADVLAGRYLPRAYPSLEELGPELNKVAVSAVSAAAAAAVVVAVAAVVFLLLVVGRDWFYRRCGRFGGLSLEQVPWRGPPSSAYPLRVSREWAEGSKMLR